MNGDPPTDEVQTEKPSEEKADLRQDKQDDSDTPDRSSIAAQSIEPGNGTNTQQEANVQLQKDDELVGTASRRMGRKPLKGRRSDVRTVRSRLRTQPRTQPRQPRPRKMERPKPRTKSPTIQPGSTPSARPSR